MTDPRIEPTPLDLAALTEIAESATPGPWEPADEDGWIGAHRCYVVSSDEDSITDAGTPVRLKYNRPSDALHIAAFDPPTALALIARAEAAEAKVASVRELHSLDTHVCACGETHGPYCKTCQYDYPCPTIDAMEEL